MPRHANPRRRVPVFGLAAAAGSWFGLAAVCRAQDSTATAPGLPGDALDAYRTSPSEQLNHYVVDLATKQGSWGGRFALGPIAKASRANSTGLFNHYIGSQAASAIMVRAPYLASSYHAWHAPGQGVNETSNATPTDDGTGQYGLLATAGRHGTRLGLAFMEFGAGPDAVMGTGDDEQNVITALVEIPTRRPNRLFVSRIAALQNKPSNASGNVATASFGLGGIDTSGAVHLLADGYGMAATARLANKQLLRVRAGARAAGVVNRVQQGGAQDAAATDLVLDTQTSLLTPTVIPGALAGRAVLVGSDFASNYLYESAPLTITTTKDYLPGGSGSARGNISYAPRVFAPLASGGGEAGTLASFSRTDNDTTTRAISVFVVNADGSVDAQQQLTLPGTAAALTDPTDGFQPGVHLGPLSAHEFSGYQGQVPFRGGNGQAALTVLANGDLLVAATVSALGGGGLPQGQDTYIAVARVSAATGQVTWRVAAHTGDWAGAAGGLSKVIRGDYGADGLPGTGDPGEGDGQLDAAPIGRLARYSEVYPDRPWGPSISAPAMDAKGNLYFTAALRLGPQANPVHTVGLLKAVFDGAGGHTLELIARQGDVIQGANSTVNYQIALLPLADGDGADSGAIWSGNLAHDFLPLVDPAAVAPSSPAALGALVFRARLIYDVNADGQFIDPATTGNSGPDQAYHAVMLLMPAVRPGDTNRDGLITSADISWFLGRWFADLTANTRHADWDGNDIVGSADISAMLQDWFASL
ncbi:MAG TPA: hypothetical protein VD963_09610 [Phycisphaerales bacterium]|nr:hypothetical protein [Phycisphaerales bacterium]